MKKGYLFLCLLFLASCAMSGQKTGALPTTSRAKAHINQPDAAGKTPLMFAAQNISNAEIIQTMVRKGANPNQQDHRGWTALTWAVVYNKNPKVISALLKQGADPNILTYTGNRPIDFAKNNKALLHTSDFQLLQSLTVKREGD